MFRNGAVIGQFTGALPESVVRTFIKEMTAAEPPTDHLNLPNDLAKRLAQAQSHLQRGRGFEAFMLLNNFPGSNQEAEAQALLPLARFLMDIEDGDALTGIETLDEAYQNTADSLRRRKLADALDYLLAALALGEEIDRPYIRDIIDSLFALLGPNHKVTKEYQPKLSPITE